MALKGKNKRQAPVDSSHSSEAQSGEAHSSKASSSEAQSGEADSSEAHYDENDEDSSHPDEDEEEDDEDSSHPDEDEEEEDEDSSHPDEDEEEDDDDASSGSKEQLTKPTKSTKSTKPTNPTRPPTQTITPAKIVSTTTPEPTTTTPKPTTTTPEPTTTTPEPTTTTPQPTTTTQKPTTTTPQPTTTTQKPTTTTPQPTTTTQKPTTTTPESTTTIPTCDPECKNNGMCIGHNVCDCTTDFSGPTCEVQSVGLCLNSETFNTKPILLITFGNGSAQYSTAAPADFHFSTTYQQRFAPTTNDGMFSLVNLVNENSAWHTNAMDHTGNNGGYMYLVNADYTPGQFYNGRVDNLCVGLRYEFSVYLANLCKPSGRINPNVLFEVRSTDGNVLLAQLNSGDVAEHDTLTWEKYGFSFIAPSSSVNLLMISNALGGDGNDIVIDDIALRVCAYEGTGFCPSN